MHSLKETPDPALEVVAHAGVESWRVRSSLVPGILSAHLDVRLPQTVERFSFSVFGWTEEELRNRIECLRYSAASLLRRRRGALVEAGGEA